jgi:hypothetical protein
LTLQAALEAVAETATSTAAKRVFESTVMAGLQGCEFQVSPEA